MAREIAADPELREEAIAKLTKDFFSNNVAATKKAKRALAEDLVQLAGFDEVYPLSPDKVKVAAAALKGAHFRSAASYIGELRLGHIERDLVISPALGRMLKLVNDSMERGIGPPQKATEAQFEEFDLLVDNDAFILGGTDSYVVAVNWLLREAELLNIRADPSHVYITGAVGCEVVTLRLPTSKNDQTGLGAARTLSHECDGRGRLLMRTSSTCPVCAILRQLRRLYAKFGCESIEDLSAHQLPLFPASNGDAPSKNLVIEAWSAGWLNPSGARALSGHSARRTGAKRRAKLGWSLWQIQFMGRWAASTVVDYVEEAMAEVTVDWSAGAGGQDQQEPECSHTSLAIPALSDRVEKLEARLEEWRNAGKAFDNNSLDMMAPGAEYSAYKVLLTGTRAHKIDSSILEWPRTLWVTSCGWRCGANAKIKIFESSKFEKCGTELCGRPGCWASRPQGS